MRPAPLLALSLAAAALIPPPARAQQAHDSATARTSVFRARTLAEDLQLFSQVLNLLRVNHADTLDVNELVLAAIEGMVDAADPHSYVIPRPRLDPEKLEEWRDSRISAVPIQFLYLDGVPLVYGVMPGTEAARQDILPGDELVTIDGQPVRAESEEELQFTLAGPEGGAVTLGFDRWALDGTRTSFERTVRRERPDEGTAVPRGVMLDGNVGYVRISTFGDFNVADHLRDRVGRLEDQGMGALILDLRDNGGGLVGQAAEIAGEFLPEGAVVFIAEQRKSASADTGRVERSFWQSARNYPLIVLVNEMTASASELVSGALQDHDRALIMGRPTFGKALMMTGFLLSDGSELTLTIGRIRTPCGRVIQRTYQGVEVSRYEWLAGEVADTADLPTCTSNSGRTLYGGGGIHPDVVLPRPPGVSMLVAGRQWLDRDLAISRWASSYVAERGDALTDPLALLREETAAEAVASFLERMRAEGLDIGGGADTPELRLRLLPRIAEIRWGETEADAVATRLDPWIRAALDAIPQARALVGTAP